MNLYLDINSRTAVTGIGVASPLPPVTFKDQDTPAINIYFCLEGVVQDEGSGAAIKFGLNLPPPNPISLLVYDTTFTKQTDVNGNVYYQGFPVFYTSQLVTALGSNTSIQCVGEVRTQLSDGEIWRSMDINFTIWRTILLETTTPPPVVVNTYPDASTLELITRKGQPSGYPGLDASGLLNGAVIPVDGKTIVVSGGKLASASILATTAANFTTPAANGTVSVTFISTSGLVVGQYVRISIAGYYIVNSITDATHAVLTNNGDPFNAGSGVTITSGAVLLPAQAAAGGGTTGQNAYTTLAAGFTVPASGVTISINVASTAWMPGPGYALFIGGAGYYLINAIIDATHVVLVNSGSAANQPPGTNVASGATITGAGPQGAPGTAGASLSAYDSTAASFTMPSVGSSVAITIGNTAWLSANQIIYIGSAGYFQVATVVNATIINCTNLNYPGNASAGAVIAQGSKVSPGGLQGPQGAGGPGLNAFTTLSANFTQPAVNATVTVNVGTTAWMAPGLGIFIQGGGYYTIASISDLTHAVVTNLGGASNIAPTSTVTGTGTQTVSPAGVPGTSGANAFTVTTAPFTQPTSGSTVTVTVGNTAWMAQGQNLFIPGAGYYSVSTIVDAIHVVLINSGTAGNAGAGNTIATGSSVSSAGAQGQPGIQGIQGPQGGSGAQESLGAHIESPTAKTYTVDLAASSPYTIKAFKCILGAGTCTLALVQNGSNVSGAGAISVSTTLSSTTLNQAVALNDKIQITLSALSGSPADLQFTMWIQR